MATADAEFKESGLSLNRGIGNKIALAFGIAATSAVMVGFWLWSQTPDYKVLFSNYSDKDGGAIVAALDQMGVPYKFSEAGAAILVPNDQVHTARLKIASMGLPKGGNVGFELLENQKFGVSQFVEQVNFQRGLEGELEKSIQAMDSVEVARVHLAIPKSTVFVREKQKPTASVMLNVRTGRSLSEEQVSSIVHLVASSVPDLPVNNVTVVDQNGNLLSDAKKPAENSKNLDATQLKYVEEVQQSIIKRVESILKPLVGEKNVHAQATAEVDFSVVEQAEELYKPNLSPEFSVVRSQQSAESTSTSMTPQDGGVPGALTNQPPANATAPIVGSNQAAGTTGTPQIPVNSEKNTTTNYEVDKTVRYSQNSHGGIKRLTVAIIVNNKEVVGKNGKVTSVPLTDAEKKQITDLAKDAMGFKEDRGDSISLVNYSFVPEKVVKPEELPVWKNPEYIDTGKNALNTILGLIILFLLYKKAIKPMVARLTAPKELPPPPRVGDNDGVMVDIGGGSVPRRQPRDYKESLNAAQQLAKENPKMVAGLVTAWVSGGSNE